MNQVFPFVCLLGKLNRNLEVHYVSILFSYIKFKKKLKSSSERNKKEKGPRAKNKS